MKNISYKSIKNICDNELKLKNYIINDNGVVDVKGNVHL